VGRRWRPTARVPQIVVRLRDPPLLNGERLTMYGRADKFFRSRLPLFPVGLGRRGTFIRKPAGDEPAG
jgi:hypothetical protein